MVPPALRELSIGQADRITRYLLYSVVILFLPGWLLQRTRSVMLYDKP
jgi:hypothetical protein